MKICKAIRLAILKHSGSWSERCFRGWRAFVVINKAEKRAQIQAIIARFRMANVYNKFTRIREFAKRAKNCKLVLKRIFHYPLFQRWLDYAKWNKHLNLVFRASRLIQKQIRVFITRRVFKRVHVRYLSAHTARNTHATHARARAHTHARARPSCTQVTQRDTIEDRLNHTHSHTRAHTHSPA